MYGIVTALPSENEAVIESMSNIKDCAINGIHYIRGSIGGMEVVTVITGIGKVNAAAITSRLIENFKPKAIFLSGIAGRINPQLTIGDIIVGVKLYSVESHRNNKYIKKDMINPVNQKPNAEILEADAGLLSIAKDVTMSCRSNNKVVYGFIATTDVYPPYARQVIDLQAMGVDALEMEGFAVMHVCWLFSVPCLVVRSISDYSTNSLNFYYQANQYNIRDEHKKIAANNACRFILFLLGKL